MLTYSEIMTTDLGKLSAAADKWDEMAKELHRVEVRYRDSVQVLPDSPAWMGLSANAARTNFSATRYEYQAAQTQAKATATLLRNGHQQFVELKKQLESARADAVKAGMKVSEEGRVAYDHERLTPGEKQAVMHDPDYAKSIRAAETAWDEQLDSCVKAFDLADQDLKKDLEAVVKDSGGGKNDETLGTGFNGGADKVAAADDKAKADRMDLAWLEMKDSETLDDYIKRLQKEGLTRLTGNPQLAELVTKFTNGAITAGAFTGALTAAGLYSYKLSKALRPPFVHPTAPGTFLSKHFNMRLAGAAPGSLLSKIPPGLATALTGSDEAAMWGGFMRNGSFFMPTAAEANLLKVAQNGGLANAAKAAGWLRGAGVVGGVAATAYGVANLATYDTDMIKADPAKFASDLTGTAFSASMTALTVAPTPVTLGLAIGTGVAYGAALIWDNHEAIGKGLEDAGEWVGDKASDIGEGIKDGAKKLGSALNPFD
ncbi:hypothetical protein HHL19_26875 [Streptomyces sp. R302]|uniref:hypothetical protein n=1 Tax=unclassified Streptomyces TaxID=2593676 RepID=UPI00145D7ECC|nr:hypothetical protein [Streptomyces sp. R301]NML82178.1 hypothetical protein [Streptomyces sp. R302]